MEKDYSCSSSNNDNDLLHLTLNKEIVKLFKTFLEIIEDFKVDHQILVKKLKEENIDISDLDYFTPEKYEHLRKRVLDSGNETLRNLLSLLEFYDFVINKEKLSKLMSQRKVVKKFTINSPIIIVE